MTLVRRGDEVNLYFTQNKSVIITSNWVFYTVSLFACNSLLLFQKVRGLIVLSFHILFYSNLQFYLC